MKLHERPGYKRIPITIVLHLYETVQDDLEDEGRFFVEENHCLDNYITELARTKDRHEHPSKPIGYCVTCSRGEAFLGHIPFDEIRKAQPPPGTTNPNATDYEASDEDPWADERPASQRQSKGDSE